MHELVVCVDLLRRGYHVFRAVAPNCACDLLILKDGTLTRVEVTTGYIGLKGNLAHPVKDPNRFDLLAVVTYREDGREDIVYRPDGLLK